MERKSKCFGYELHIEHRGRNGEERRVEAVEHAAVSGENLTAVFDAEVTLEKTFYQIAPRAENADGQSETDPAEGTEGDVGKHLTEDESENDHEHAATYGADPRFVG